MTGIEIGALVAGVIAAIKAVPEIPSVWRRLFRHRKDRGKDRRKETEVGNILTKTKTRLPLSHTNECF